MQLSLHYATVIDNNETNKKSMIKERILPEMKDFDSNKLPWVRPFINQGMSEDQYSFNPPENDSKIWVVFTDKYFKEGYYLSGSFIDGHFNYTSVQTDLNKIAELSNTAYPNIRFNRLPDGTIMFHNNSTGEVGIYHSSGQYVVIDNTGAVTISKNLDVDGTLEVGTGSQPLTLYTSLESAMNILLAALSTHVHVDPLTGTTGPPTAPLLTYVNGSIIGLDLAESQKSSSD